MKTATALLLTLCYASGNAYAQCGGKERWAVKMAADQSAAQIDFANPTPTTLYNLVRLTRPQLPQDEETRTNPEMKVRVVEGRLVKFKREDGKTGDSDFHLVISDATGEYSKGGAGTTASLHSFVAEIPDPDCVRGRAADGPAPSAFEAQLESTREKFLQQFPDIKKGWNDAGGIPVTLTGIVFFDREHGQVGRAPNGLELHPLIDIDFGDVNNLVSVLSNGDFEAGNQGWAASPNVITADDGEEAFAGSRKAWLGGYGETHRDTLSQRITLPASASSITLTFQLHVDTEESDDVAYDKLRVRVRSASGTSLKLLKTFSNKDAAEGFKLRTFDLTAYKGQTIRLIFEGEEDAAARTSFVIDDVKITVRD